jgi:hypothetical protein
MRTVRAVEAGVLCGFLVSACSNGPPATGERMDAAAALGTEDAMQDANGGGCRAASDCNAGTSGGVPSPTSMLCAIPNDCQSVCPCGPASPPECLSCIDQAARCHGPAADCGPDGYPKRCKADADCTSFCVNGFCSSVLGVCTIARQCP